MWISLPGGYLTVGATPVQVSTTSIRCHGVKIQQVNGNTKVIYLMDKSNGSYSTGVGVVAAVAAPAYDTNSNPISLPSESGAIAGCPDPLDLKFFWIHGEHSGDKVMISYTEW
jgi:hypothetical protein